MISWNRIIRRNGDHLFFSCSFRFLARLLSLPFYPSPPSPSFFLGSALASLTKLTNYVFKLTQVTAQQPSLGCVSYGQPGIVFGNRLGNATDLLLE